MCKKTVADYPELVAQWHPTKNGDLKPKDVSYGSDKRVWWKCLKDEDHEWNSAASSRTITGAGCPFCSNQKACKSNCLATTHPHLVEEWHPKNQKTPFDVVAGSSKKVWWQCPIETDHEYQCQINQRALGGIGCSCCAGKTVVPSNSLATNSPHLCNEWHPTKNNGLTPNDVTQRSGKKVWWKCQKGHEWQATVCARVSVGSSCPYCSNKLVCESNCLATVRPDLAAQWHPTKNGDLTPNNVVAGTGRKIWWKCDVAEDHEWESSPATRITEGTGCPCCSGRKVVPSNCLATTHSYLVDEWHDKNKKTACDFTYGSGVEVWWCCEDGHEWKTAINNRTLQKQGCPYCSRKRVCKENSISTTHPEIAAQWHPTKNGDLTSNDVLYGTNKKVWWKCSVADDHEWKESVNMRTSRGFGCPFCSNNRLCESNCLATVRPDLAAQWHPTKNGDLTPNDVLAGGLTKVWWQCSEGDDHEWEAVIANRMNGTGCPICMNRLVVPSNCLATTHPDLAGQWHPTKNGTLTPHDITNCKKKVWWKCPVADDHEWEAAIFSRIRDNRGCPFCANQKVTESNCLLVTHPEVANKWHPTKNGNSHPRDFTCGSNTKVWWKCPVADDHEWEAPVYRLANKESECPCCTGHKIVLSNCLEATNPQLAAEWHPTKNGSLTPRDVMAGGAARVWWKCSEGHEWKSQLASRAKGCGCPICRESKGEKNVAGVLTSLGLKFERQVTFDDCKHKNRLPFDFGVTVNEILCLIEYQGQQHYEPVAFGSKSDDPVHRFKMVKKRDRIKKDYCSKQQIPFMAIPYWEMDNIPTLIQDFIETVKNNSEPSEKSDCAA